MLKTPVHCFLRIPEVSHRDMLTSTKRKEMLIVAKVWYEITC
jgi:hypothetical protein